MEMSEAWTSDSKIQARKNLEVGDKKKNQLLVSFPLGNLWGKWKNLWRKGMKALLAGGLR